MFSWNFHPETPGKISRPHSAKTTRKYFDGGQSPAGTGGSKKHVPRPFIFYVASTMGTHVSFIILGYNPYFGGVKPSFLMVLGSKGSSWQRSVISRLYKLFQGFILHL